MGVLSVTIGVAFLVYLLLRIASILGGQNTKVGSTHVMTEEHYDNRPILPKKSAEEIGGELAQLPSKWLMYDGATPPLELKVRGITEELYRRLMRAHLDAFGQNAGTDADG